MVGGWRVQVQPTNQHLLHVCTLWQVESNQTPQEISVNGCRLASGVLTVFLYFIFGLTSCIRLTLNFTDLKACNEAAVKHLLSPALHGWLVLVVTSEKQSKPSSGK